MGRGFYYVFYVGLEFKFYRWVEDIVVYFYEALFVIGGI